MPAAPPVPASFFSTFPVLQQSVISGGPLAPPACPAMPPNRASPPSPAILPSLAQRRITAGAASLAHSPARPPPKPPLTVIAAWFTQSSRVPPFKRPTTPPAVRAVMLESAPTVTPRITASCANPISPPPSSEASWIKRCFTVWPAPSSVPVKCGAPALPTGVQGSAFVTSSASVSPV